MPVITLDSVFVTETGAIDRKGVRRYTRQYLVEASDVNATTAQVDSVLPAWGDAHPDDPNATVKQATVKQRPGELCFWDCTIEYDTEDNEAARNADPSSAPGESSQNVHPLLRPWAYKWSSRHRSKFLQKDLRSDALGGPRNVVNTAKQMLGSGLEVPVANPVLSVTGWKSVDPGDAELFLDPGARDEQKISDYVNKVNDRTFRGVWPAGWARCTDYSLTSVHEFGQWFWQFDIAIEFQEGGWNPFKALNAGTVVLGKYNPDTHQYGPPNPVKYANGVTPAGAVPLSLDGTRALRQDETPIYLEFTPYAYADFAYIVTGTPP